MLMDFEKEAVSFNSAGRHARRTAIVVVTPANHCVS
jgi:hypothetical protein